MAKIGDVNLVCSWYSLFGLNTPWAFFRTFNELMEIIKQGGFDGAMLAEVHRTRSWSDLVHGLASPDALDRVVSLAGSFRGEKGLGVVLNRRFSLTLAVWPFLPHVHDRESVIRLQTLVGRGKLPVNFEWSRPTPFSRERGKFADENFQLTPEAWEEIGFQNVRTLVQNLEAYRFSSVAIDLGIIQDPTFGGFIPFWNQIKNHVSSVHVPYDRDDLDQPWIHVGNNLNGLLSTGATMVMLRHIRESEWPAGSALPPKTVFQIVLEVRPGAVLRHRRRAGLSHGLLTTRKELSEFYQTFTGRVRESLGTS